MRWKFTSAVVAAGLFAVAAASAAQTKDYIDSKAGFRVTIPKGWTRTKDDDELVVRSPDTSKTFGFCFVHKHPFPQTESLSQSEIDLRLAGKLTRSYWQAEFGGSYLKNFVVEDSGEEVQNGWTAHYAVMTYEKYHKAHRFKTVAYFLPGLHYALTCDSYLEAYPREAVAFETFFDSFVPIGLAKD